MSSSARLHYLDNLRVFCMLFGILVQTNRLAEQEPWLVFVDVSGFFRMATFFAVSGYFAAMLYQRRRAIRFFRHRAVAILVPLAFGLLVVNPVTISLMAGFHDPDAPRLGYVEALSGLWRDRAGPQGPGAQVLHLWFLIALAFYVALVPAFVFALERLGGLFERAATLPAATLPLAVSVTVTLLVVFARTFDEGLARIFGESAVVEESVMFTPYFVLGVFGYLFPAVWRRLHAIDLPTIAVAAALMLAHHVIFGDALSPSSTMLKVAAEAMTTMACVFALLWVFGRWFDFETPTTRFLSEGIYTVYILQILLIYLLGSALALLGVPAGWMFWPVVVLTFVLGYAIYHRVVARSPLLSLLLRGRVIEARRAARHRKSA